MSMSPKAKVEMTKLKAKLDELVSLEAAQKMEQWHTGVMINDCLTSMARLQHDHDAYWISPERRSVARRGRKPTGHKKKGK